MISQKYTLPVAVLLAIALIPTVIHNYIGAKTTDDYSTRSLAQNIGALNGAPTDRRAGYGQEVFDSFDWIERWYTAADGKRVRLFIARSYDHKKLYHHPEIAVIRGTDVTSAGAANIGNPHNIPVHVIHEQDGSGVAAYTLVYDGTLVENPIKHQLVSALTQLFTPQKPMTLIFAYAPEQSTQDKLHGSDLERVIQAATTALTQHRN